MDTIFQSLSWALMQSLLQGVLVYVALTIMLWAIPAGRARLRYNLTFLALIALCCSFFVSWRREYQVLALLSDAPLAIIDPSSFTSSVLRAPGSPVLATMARQLSPWLGAFYAVGVLIMSGRFVLGIRHVVSLSSMGTSPATDGLQEIFAALRRQLNVTGGARLLVSARARVPMVVGILKPVVLIPASVLMQLNSRELEAILLHELAHVKRYDHIANILQAAIEAILFFNPFAWLISARLRDERERCCDDMVIGFGNEPVIYATALTQLAVNGGSGNLLTLAATGQPRRLFARVRRMVEGRDLRFNYGRVIASCILLAFMSVSIAWLRPLPHHKGKKRVSALSAPGDARRHGENIASVATHIEHEPGTSVKEAVAPRVSGSRSAAVAPRVAAADVNLQTAANDENLLVSRLLQDKMVDQVRGFLVERHFKDLYINRQMLPQDVAGKYLQGLSKDIIRVQVFPMEERMRMHPDADFIQVLLPFTFESPCVEKPSKREGC